MRGPAGRQGSLLPPLPQGSQVSSAAASRLGSLARSSSRAYPKCCSTAAMSP